MRFQAEIAILQRNQNQLDEGLNEDYSGKQAVIHGKTVGHGEAASLTAAASDLEKAPDILAASDDHLGGSYLVSRTADSTS